MNLTPGQLERLAILAEECAEVIVAINKIVRHGYYSRNPDDPAHINNKHDLEREIGDVEHIIARMVNNVDVERHVINSYKQLKQNKKQYLHHQTP